MTPRGIGVQSNDCAISLSTEKLYTHLNEFTGAHDMHFAKKLKYQMNKFTASACNHEQWQQLSSCQLIVKQVKYSLEEERFLSLFTS